MELPAITAVQVHSVPKVCQNPKLLPTHFGNTVGIPIPILNPTSRYELAKIHQECHVVCQRKPEVSENQGYALAAYQGNKAFLTQTLLPVLLPAC